MSGRPRFIPTDPARSKKVQRVKSKAKPAWNDTLTDQSIYKASPEDLRRRAEIHKSKFSDVKYRNQNKWSREQNINVSDKYSILMDFFDHYSQFEGAMKASDDILKSALDLDLRYPTKNVGLPLTTKASTTRGSSDCRKSNGGDERSLAFHHETVMKPSVLNDDKVVPSISSKHRLLNGNRKSSNDDGEVTPLDKELENLQNNGSEPLDELVDDVNTMSGFTTSLLKSLKDLDDKYSNVRLELNEERQARKVLENEVITQKVIINELTAEMIEVRQQLIRWQGFKDHQVTCTGQTAWQQHDSSKQTAVGSTHNANVTNKCYDLSHPSENSYSNLPAKNLVPDHDVKITKPLSERNKMKNSMLYAVALNQPLQFNLSLNDA